MSLAATSPLVASILPARAMAMMRLQGWWQRRRQAAVLRQVDPRLCEDAGLRRPAAPARPPIRLPL